jgi:hypothetical protein
MALVGLMAEPFEAGVGSIGFYPAVHALAERLAAGGHLAEGSTRYRFQARPRSVEGGIAGQREFVPVWADLSQPMLTC